MTTARTEPKSRTVLKLMKTHGALTTLDLIRHTGWTTKDARTALHSLRKRAWLSSEWIEGTKSKVYSLTNMGFVALELDHRGIRNRPPTRTAPPKLDTATIVAKTANSVFQLGEKA